MLAPAREGRHQAQAFPVSQAARIHPNDAAGFFPREALRQASGPRKEKFSANDYAPNVNGDKGDVCVERANG